jgi:hypothetical protein
MAGWHRIKRPEFIRKLRALGFEGPYRGTRHEFMIFGHYRQTLPSNSEYSISQLKMLMRQIETVLNRRVLIEEWDAL